MENENPLIHYLRAGETSISNLLLHHYHDLGMTTGELVVYLEFKSYLDRGILDPDIRKIANHLGTDEKQVFDLLHQMMNNKLVTQQMRKLDDGKEDAFWDFTPLLNKLGALTDQNESEEKEKQTNSNRIESFNKIEAEIGRPLSPMELQIVSDWFDRDHYQPDIINLALRQAVMNSALSLQYMDRILRNWAHQGLRSVHDVQEHERRFEERKSNSYSENHSPKKVQGPEIPIFNINDKTKNSKGR